jgi:hypothetical protein
VTSTKILKLIPTMQGLELLNENVKFANKKNKKSSDFIGVGIKNIVGINLINEVASL